MGRHSGGPFLYLPRLRRTHHDYRNLWKTDAAGATGVSMSDALSTRHIDCRLCTGSAGLLRRTGNTPINRPALSSKQTEIFKLRCLIKTLDSRNHRRDQNRSNSYSLNPHSSIKTTQRDQLRPAVSSPEYYPTPAPNADVIRQPLLVGRHLIILNMSSHWLLKRRPRRSGTFRTLSQQPWLGFEST